MKLLQGSMTFFTKLCRIYRVKAQTQTERRGQFKLGGDSEMDLIGAAKDSGIIKSQSMPSDVASENFVNKELVIEREKESPNKLEESTVIVEAHCEANNQPQRESSETITEFTGKDSVSFQQQDEFTCKEEQKPKIILTSNPF
jgi:hypothetical protein